MITLRPFYNKELTNLSSLLNIPINELTTTIETNANRHIGIDEEKLLGVITDRVVNSTTQITNSRQWLKAMLFIYLNEKRHEVIKDDCVNIIPLYNEFRKLGFSGSDVDKYLIEELENAILGQPHIKVSEIAELNSNIVNYMVAKNENTYSKFAEYLLKSKLVRTNCNIDVETLRKKVDRELKEMEEILNVIYGKPTASVN